MNIRNVIIKFLDKENNKPFFEVEYEMELWQLQQTNDKWYDEIDKDIRGWGKATMLMWDDIN